MTSLAGALRARFEVVLLEASRVAHEAFEPAPGLPEAARLARSHVERAYKGFERYDSAVFPIIFGTNVGECEPIDVHRISPDDAAETIERFGSLARIRGQALAAFGAFLDETWRRNDILLGRFHGAERLIAMILPGQDGATTSIRKSLIAEAHQEIACDFLELNAAQRADWVEHVKAFLRSVKDQPNPELMARAATRASAVTGALLEGISDARHAPGKQAFRYMALLSRFLFQFVEVSVPHTLGELFGKYWLQLLALFAVMLAVLGFFKEQVWSLAAIAAAAVVALFWARQLLRRYLRGQLLLSPAATMAITAAVVFGLTALIAFLPELSPWVNGVLHGFWDRVTTAWQARTPAADADRLKRLSNALLSAAFVVTLASGLVLGRVMKRIPARPGSAKNPVRKMQAARTRQDVIDAVGRYDLATRSGVEQAMRADFGFAAAYALLFVAIGLFLAVRGEVAALAIGGLGIAAGVCDALENRAVLRALVPSLEEPAAVLSPSPRGLSMAKWTLVAAAVVTIAFVAFT